jgi:hypothetical protein
MHLTATGLPHREVDGVAQSLEKPDHRLTGVGKERVIEAGDEQRNSHRLYLADKVRSRQEGGSRGQRLDHPRGFPSL